MWLDGGGSGAEGESVRAARAARWRMVGWATVASAMSGGRGR
jgi:hypothetical protein